MAINGGVIMSGGSSQQTSQLDPALRDAYLQKRINDIYDGNPPVLDDFDESDDAAPMVAPNQSMTTGKPSPKQP